MKKIALLVGDVILLYVSLAITLSIRFQYLGQELWQRHVGVFSIAFVLWLIIFFINGLYDLRKVKQDFRFYGDLMQNMLINAILSVLLFYVFLGRVSDLRPQTILLILLVVFAVLFIIWRKLFFKAISSSALSNNLAIIGMDKTSIGLAKEIISKPQLGYKLKLIINPDNVELPSELRDILQVNQIENLREQLKSNQINTVVTLTNMPYSNEVARHLFDNIDLKIQYFNLINFYEKTIGKIPLGALEKNWFLENVTQKNSQWLTNSKRLVDLFFGLFFGLISLLIVPLLIIIIKLESKGPIIYKQQRVGLNNKIYTVYKFRSMVMNAENNGAVWASKNDARVTRIGKIMRKTRLDEIPQFWNIIKGNMSFVGPRPERPEFVEQLKKEIPFYNERHLVKPGLSGWAQINYPYGASVEDAKEKLCYDLYYIKNQSIALDISIILKTINTVFNIALGR